MNLTVPFQNATNDVRLDARLIAPATGKPLMILAHGAGADLNHVHMESIAVALSQTGVGTFRFNFPFMQAGKKRVDKTPDCVDVIATIVAYVREQFPDTELLLGGHSFGGRMASHYQTQNPGSPCKALVFFSFPLHVADKPDTKRAAHLSSIDIPMLFLSGDRDKLAEPGRLRQVVDSLPGATLHFLDTADHSFKILKRSRVSSQDVYEEAAYKLEQWLSQRDR